MSGPVKMILRKDYNILRILFVLMRLQKNLQTYMFILSYLTKKVPMPPKKVTKISTVCEVLKKYRQTRNAFQQYINSFKFTSA